MPNDPELVIIAPASRWPELGLRDLWARRDLLYFLTMRDVKTRYSQTVLGWLWAFIPPVMSMVTCSILFGGLLKVSSDGHPYPIFYYAGALPWGFFSQVVSGVAGSLLSGAGLFKKVYFNRLVIPLSSLLGQLLDFLLALGILLGLMAYYGTPFTPRLLLLPVMIILVNLISLGAGLWLAALNTQFRDMRFLLPYLMQFIMFATPVIYSYRSLPDRWRFWMGFNPLTLTVEGFRWSVLGGEAPAGELWLTGGILALVLLGSGLWYFRHLEKCWVDIL